MLRQYLQDVRPHIALYLILLCTATALLPSMSRAVMCVGEDGHIAIEMALDGDCTDIVTTQPRSVVKLTSNGSCCGPCSDTPVTAAGSSAVLCSAMQLERLVAPYETVTAVPNSATDPLAARMPDPLFQLRHAPPDDPAHAKLASVILLT